MYENCFWPVCIRTRGKTTLYGSGLSGGLHIGIAAILNAVFLRHAWLVHKRYSDLLAHNAFTWSIIYLALLFAGLLADHYWKRLF
jgi:protoheme IX farnesyltransferase